MSMGASFHFKDEEIKVFCEKWDWFFKSIGSDSNKIDDVDICMERMTSERLIDDCKYYVNDNEGHEGFTNITIEGRGTIYLGPVGKFLKGKKYVVLEHLQLPNRGFRFWSMNSDNNI